MHHDHREDFGPRDRREFEGRDRCCGPDCHCHDPEPDFGFQRRFVSKAEMLEALEWYLSELLNEAQGVREAIADLKEEIAEETGTPAPAPAPQAAPTRKRRPRKAAEPQAPRRPRGRPRKTPTNPPPSE